MAGERHGLAFFPGVQQVASCSYTIGHGITPGVIELVIAPQLNFTAAGGTLTITDGYGTISLPGCKVDRHSFERNASGYIWRLSILDRRWRWRFGSISGRYNVHDQKGNLITRTAKTPRELATLCLVAAGETGFDVSALPDDEGIRPLVDWDHDNPMEALSSLIEGFGCRVVYRPDADAVILAKPGVGLELPGGDLMEDGLVVDPPERPDRIWVACGPTIYNSWLALEAVGLETDGTYRPIDQLSYKPSTGWGTCYPPYFAQVALEFPPTSTEPGATSEQLELARKSVFKTYRVTTKQPGNLSVPVQIPGYGTIHFIDQILPLGEAQAQIITGTAGNDEAEADPVNEPKPARIEGAYYAGKKGTPGNTGAGEKYKDSFTIRATEGVVEFSEYTYAFNADKTRIQGAELAILVGVTVRDEDTGGLERHVREYTFQDGQTFGTPPQVVKREEIQLTVVPEYGDDYEPEEIVTNQDEVDAWADYYAIGTALQYQTPTPKERTYAGIVPIMPDGSIQQVSWSVGPGGAVTRASSNTEHDLRIPGFKELRQREKNATTLQLANSFKIKSTFAKLGHPLRG